MVSDLLYGADGCPVGDNDPVTDRVAGVDEDDSSPGDVDASVPPLVAGDEPTEVVRDEKGFSVGN
jgi:hypothetical protein